MMDSADPRNGWSTSEIRETSSGTATNDLFGKLYFMLDRLLLSFHRQLRATKVDFQFFNVDAAVLPKLLDRDTFARIEVRD